MAGNFLWLLFLLPAQGRAYDATKEGLDPKFETPWKGDAESEAQGIRHVGEVIGGFVRRNAANQKAWKEEFQALHAKLMAGKPLTADEKKRLQAMEKLVPDLPEGESATRDVHRQTHGCFAAQLKVSDDVPADLAKGIFTPGKSYDAIVRYSNGNSKNQHDFLPDARGMAVKVLDQGSLPGGENGKHLYGRDGINAAAINAKTKVNFSAINFPVFFANDPETYAKVNMNFLSTSSDPSAKLVHKVGEFKSVFLSGMDPWQSRLGLDVNGSLITDPLAETYWSMMPFRLGGKDDPNRTAVKYKWKPCKENNPGGNPDWTKKRNYPLLPQVAWRADIPKKDYDELSKESSHDYLRKKAYADLAGENAKNKCFELQAQRFVDQKSTPIEDTTSIWLENKDQQKSWAEKFAKNAGPNLFEAKRRYAEIMAKKISPPVTVARVTFAPVDPAEAEKVANGAPANHKECEDLSFDPCFGSSDEHKPLGVIGRMRCYAYAASAMARHELNGVPDDHFKKPADEPGLGTTGAGSSAE